MLLRRASPAELGPAGDVTVAAYADFVLGPDDPYVARLRDAARRDREAELWVAVDDGIAGSGAVLGTVTVCPPGSPWREVAREGEGELRMLAVSPAAQGRGVGAALLDLVVERFRREGAHAVVLSSLPQMAAAHRLYTRAGFTRMPERDHSPAPHVQLLAFRKDLTR
ncbi:GNAT family N-acetyltransferase [Nocardioides sp. IC4_145]|uniref:GNAT family N-acetyltransferase n=1 Tax=Nocardioides sp. IC4_145 TaxID=2714037 RepID=UPI00140A4E9A|nr:GNAT family N-acetyltransferase [Nocardioides sp. IC4_145]NHC24227.1 GNAT family N-acetyltransferase [Nocardioides sp. IC4_145]